MKNKNELIKEFGKSKRWVNYRFETRKGKTTKVPYSITGRKASSTNPDDWATFDEAKKVSDQVGIVFTPAQDLLGIDIDHCLSGKKITHEQKETIAELILEADTYTEISPSGEGLHLFLKIEGGNFKLKTNKRSPFELYTSGRYFTYTGNSYGEEREVRTVTGEEASRILAVIGYPWKEQAAEPVGDPEVGKKERQAVGSLMLSDDEILQKLFKSKSGQKARKLYDADISEYNDDASSADMAFLSHLAFWTQKDRAQMERIWLASPLGQRKKTKLREDYRNRTLSAAINSCTKTYEPPKSKAEIAVETEIDLLYVVGLKGLITYLQNTENMCRILLKHSEFVGRFRYDIFKNVFEIKKDEKWRTLEDSDVIDVQTKISVLFPEWFGKVGKDMVYDAIIKVSKESQIDSASDFVKSLKWDGEKRLDLWLTKTYGTPDDVYHKAVASNWIKGLVKRITEPGCKFDYVLVLEGEQGARKSTSLAILGGDWHVETTMSTDSKDFFMQFQGKAIVEFSEGETLSRTEVKRMKAIITMQSDKYRPPYERTSQDFPRRCVFAMTTNQTEYLKDETGNRRWLPVTVVLPQADVEWLQENRDQLFAEAYARLQNGETTYEFPVEETLLQQQLRRISDPNEDKIMDWYVNAVSDNDKSDGITIDRCYKEALHGNFPTRPMSKFEQMSIAAVLKDHLKLTKKDSIRSGVRSVRWFNDKGLVPMKRDDETDQEEFVRNIKWDEKDF
jgi:putative DNA primase/helicase